MMASFLTSAAWAPAVIATASARAPAVCSRYPENLVLVMISSLPDSLLFVQTISCSTPLLADPSRVVARLHLLMLLGARRRRRTPLNYPAPCGRPRACAPAPGEAGRSSPACS